MRLVQSILVVLLLWSFQTIFPQSFDQDILRFQQAVEQGDRVQAWQLLKQLYSSSPTQVYRVADACEQLFLGSNPSQSGTDSLIAIYQTGAKAQPQLVHEWLFRQAALAVRFPEWHGNKGISWAHACIQSAPLKCPIQTFQFWGDLLETTSRSKRPAIASLMSQWMTIERALLMRTLSPGEHPEEAAILQRQLHRKLQEIVPACGAFKSKNYTSEFEIEAAIALLALHNCDQETDWEWARQKSPSRGSAWSLAYLAQHAQFKEEFSEALRWLDTAIGNEEEDLLKAALYHRKSILLGAKNEFRPARAALLRAIELAPSHGEFLLDLADLYLTGAKTCNWTAFDAKAVYWLAIDCCRKARSTAPHLSAEADQRIYRYKQLMPTGAEIRFKGLQAGDSWPLPCWMGMVTTVKVN